MMKLAYLLLFALLAYITSRMAAAYTDMSKELRELRVRCMRSGGTGTEADTERTGSVASAAARDTLSVSGELTKASAVLQSLANRFASD